MFQNIYLNISNINKHTVIHSTFPTISHYLQLLIDKINLKIQKYVAIIYINDLIFFLKM